MTAGIISATGRDVNISASASRFADVNYIQTDAAINPGNSGGPLVNMNSEVIGINAMIVSNTGVNDGVGFAIPSNTARKVYEQLVKTGRVSRGYLGVSMRTVTPELAKTFGYEGKDGVIVSDIADNTSPAAKAGLQSGDIIVQFDGKDVKTSFDLGRVVADTPIGKTAEVKFFREGKPQTTKVTVAERPVQDGELIAGDQGERSTASKLGVSLSTITPERAAQLKLRIPSGALIESVEQGSPASEAGLQRGDIIHRINRNVVKSAEDVIKAISNMGIDTMVILQVERGGRISLVTVSLD
jgi:serine protease Do